MRGSKYLELRQSAPTTVIVTQFANHIQNIFLISKPFAKDIIVIFLDVALILF